RQQLRVAEYRRNLEEQQRRLQWQTEQLQRQRRLAQYRCQREYLEHLRQEEIRIRQARYDYYSDPYFYSSPIYRYYRGGSYYEAGYYSRYKYGTCSNGEYGVLGAVVGQILNLVALR